MLTPTPFNFGSSVEMANKLNAESAPFCSRLLNKSKRISFLDRCYCFYNPTNPIQSNSLTTGVEYTKYCINPQT